MKRVLMAFGMMFAAMVLGLAFIAFQAVGASSHNTQTAVSAVKEISTNWRIKQRTNLVDPSLISIADEPDVVRAFGVFERYGALLSATEATQTNYDMSTDTGTTAIVEFLGTFEYGQAKVTVKLHWHDGKMKVYGIELEPVKEANNALRLKA